MGNRYIIVDDTTGKRKRGGTIFTTASDLPMASTAGSVNSSVQHMQDFFHSTGWVSGGVISDAGAGVITVSAGSGLIRATNNDVGQILFTDWAASTAGNVVLTNNAINYVYIEYNSGSPRVIATTVERTDYNTNIFIGSVFREETVVHINQAGKVKVSDHAGAMIRREKETMPFAAASGLMLSGVGTRNIMISSGVIWEGLNRFITPSIDTSAADTFSYYYRDGVGGFTKQTNQTQINNTQYDNGTGTLATLSNNTYGVHWVYMEVDGHVMIVFGHGTYTLTQAQDAQVPAEIPPNISSTGFLVGKIIIQKSAASFTQVESARMTMFSSALASEHNTLTGLQGGTASEYYHLTAAQATKVVNGAYFVDQDYESTSSQTEFIVSQVFTANSKLDIFRGGVLMREGATHDFTRDVPNNKIVFNYGIALGFWVRVRVFV